MTGAPPAPTPARPLDDAVVAARMRGRPCLVLLDVDGTLAPLAPRPELAAVPEATRRAVAALVARPDVVVSLVSGRAAADALRMVAVPGLWAIGNHGAETVAPDGTVLVDPTVAASADAVAAAAAELAAAVGAVPGVLVEDKRWSLSIHVRLTPPARVPEVVAAVDAAGARHGLRIVPGKAIFELRAPARVDKGTAAVALAGRLGAVGRGASVLFVGDDVTDEDGFRALRAALDAGDPPPVTVRVAEAGASDGVATAAEFVLPDTDAVRRLLETLGALRGG